MLKRILTITGMILVFIGVAAVPANASTYADCPSNRFCLYSEANGGGVQYYWGPEYFAVCGNISGSWNDVASSIYNRFLNNWKVTVFRDANCLGGIISDYSLFQGYIAPGQSMNLTGGHNNVASSFKIQAIS